MPVTTAAILGGVQTVTGIAQYIKGRKLAKENKRPSYEIPNEIKQNLTQAQMMALEGLPAEQKKQYVDNIQRSQNFTLGAMDDRKAGLTGLSSLMQNSNDAYRNLLSMDAQAKQANQQQLMGQRGIMANYKDKAFDFNKVQPYEAAAQAAQAMQGAGMQNAFGGLSSIGGSLSGGAGGLGDIGKTTGTQGTTATNPVIGTVSDGGASNQMDVLQMKVSNGTATQAEKNALNTLMGMKNFSKTNSFSFG